MLDRSHHVLDQMPQHAAAIRERMTSDHEFRSLCEDFGDALEALRRWEASADNHHPERVEEFRRLVGELEADILAELGVGDRRRSSNP